LYEVLRRGVRGGPSNVHNRCNEKGKTTIKKLKFVNSEIIVEEAKDENGNPNVITHYTIFDISSLYSSALVTSRYLLVHILMVLYTCLENSDAI
jgi:hypothetical protein